MHLLIRNIGCIMDCPQQHQWSLLFAFAIEQQPWKWQQWLRMAAVGGGDSTLGDSHEKLVGRPAPLVAPALGNIRQIDTTDFLP
jgi:hypothetical protein